MGVCCLSGHVLFVSCNRKNIETVLWLQYNEWNDVDVGNVGNTVELSRGWIYVFVWNVFDWNLGDRYEIAQRLYMIAYIQKDLAVQQQHLSPHTFYMKSLEWNKDWQNVSTAGASLFEELIKLKNNNPFVTHQITLFYYPQET